jgi:hypothetical protein
MNKTRFVPLVFGALLALSGIVYAQESATVPPSMAPQSVRGVIQDVRAKRAEVIEAIKDTRKDLKTNVRDLREDAKSKIMAATSSKERREIKEDDKETMRASTTALKAERSALANKHLGLITQRYGIAIRQFENLTARIQSRIDTMRSGGADTARAESALGLAISAIAQAKADVQTLRDLIVQAVSGGNTRGARAQIETSIRKANEGIRSAHKALQEAVKTLIEISRLQRTATTSPDNIR